MERRKEEEPEKKKNSNKSINFMNNKRV